MVILSSVVATPAQRAWVTFELGRDAWPVLTCRGSLDRWLPPAQALADTLSALGFVPEQVMCGGARIDGRFPAPSGWRISEYRAFARRLQDLPGVDAAFVSAPEEGPSPFEGCWGTHPAYVISANWPEDSALCSRDIVVSATVDSAGRIETFRVSPDTASACRQAVGPLLGSWRILPAREGDHSVRGTITACRGAR